METTPQVPLHRVTAPLNWSRSGRPQLPVDGDVKSCTDKVTGVKSYSLKAQPRRDIIIGVSFFEPDPHLSKEAHAFLGKVIFGCAVTGLAVPLPQHLRFFNDTNLTLPLNGKDVDFVTCGKHWSLYTSSDMTSEEYEALYAQLLTLCVPCDMAGAAQPLNVALPPDLLDLGDLDMDRMPGDKRTSVAVMALDELVLNTTDPNARLFANLFSMHLRAMDMAFPDVLQCGAIANMVATALDSWTARSPFLLSAAREAQDMLAVALDYKPDGFEYEPFWTVHPFRFTSGAYSDELYDAEVEVCAQGFVGDEELKAKVRTAATQLFSQMSLPVCMHQMESTSFQHKGVTFQVDCLAHTPDVSCTPA